MGPIQVEPIEDRIEDPIYTAHVDEVDHGPGATADLDKATLNGVGRPQ